MTLKADKFAKDQLRAMRVICKHSRLIASYLSGILRSFCQVDVTSVEPQTYYEFINFYLILLLVSLDLGHSGSAIIEFLQI